MYIRLCTASQAPTDSCKDPMRILVASLAAAATLVTGSASAHLVEGRGASDCKAWLVARPAKSQALEAWVLGYMSGLAQWADHDLPASYTSESMVRWVDRYCKEKPKHPLTLAGYQLFGEIRRSMDKDPEKVDKVPPAAPDDKAAKAPSVPAKAPAGSAAAKDPKK
jgi:hypothetical protein